MGTRKGEGSTKDFYLKIMKKQVMGKATGKCIYDHGYIFSFFFWDKKGK